MSDAPPRNTLEADADALEVDVDALEVCAGALEVEADALEVETDFEVEIDLGDIVSEVATRYESACAPLTSRAEPVRPPQVESSCPPRQDEPSSTPHAEPEPREEAAPREEVRLPSPFGEMVARVEDARLRALVANTFARILSLIGALRAVENALTKQRVITVGALFGGVRAQAAALLAHLTATVVRDEGLGEEFREVLDGIRFVVAHEMGKVFSYEFPGITSDGPPKFTRAELTRAWGLLHNCLQQTAITLARTINPETAGQQLFEDYRAKTENSLTLYRELHVLLQKIKTAEKSSGILLKHALVRHLEHFREETMHFLMYKDWGEFGRFVDEVKRAFEEMEDFDNVLHGFAQYLSTLIHHVGMREVLHTRNGPAAKDAAPRAPATRRA